MGFFSKKPPAAPANGDDKSGGGDGGENATPGQPHRDLSKALRFFEHGQTMSDARNFDYAIDMYISGLKHNPGSIARHEQLHEIAKRRKVSGGKPMGKLDILKERMAASKDPVDKLLALEKVWSKDPFNLDVMIDLMELANKADEAEPDLVIREFTIWIGSLVLDAKLTNKALSGKEYIRVMNLLRSVGSYKQAIEACKSALMLDSSNQDLIQALKDLETQETIDKGNYERANQQGNFRNAVKDTKTQKDLENDDTLSKTEVQIEDMIKRRREEHQAKPDDVDLANKFAEALLQKNDEKCENEAIALLDKLHKATGQFRFKARAGDVRMKQIRRRVEAIKKAYEADKENAKLKAEYSQAVNEQFKFELDEYASRVKEYPTENEPRYQYARRLIYFKKYDEAISELQIAKKDAKVRSLCYQLLGDCFRIQGYLDEAVETLRQGLAEHPVKTDKTGLTLQYFLMDSLERLATKNNDPNLAREARELASAILQADINFKDIRTRIDALRKLVIKLNGGKEA